MPDVEHAGVPTMRHLVGDDVPASLRASLRNRVVMGMIGYGGGLIVALVAPLASLIIYVVTPLLYLVPARFDRDLR